VDDPVFVAYVAERLRPGDGVAKALATMRAADLYLACACARADDVAIEHFERRYFGEIDRAIAKLRTSVLPDEARQAVRVRLFAPGDGTPPKIALYGGHGDLLTWFRVLVTRTVLNLATRGPKESPVEDRMLDALPSQGNPEIDLMKRQYRAEFADAFRAALASLSDRERALLRLAYCDELSSDGIGNVYGVHRATAARWVAHARTLLHDRLRAALTRRLRLTSSELESLLRVIESQLDLSLSVELRSAGVDPV
jgi:RNA polymerase sigma-70 factor (ECF subfamily)